MRLFDTLWVDIFGEKKIKGFFFFFITYSILVGGFLPTQFDKNQIFQEKLQSKLIYFNFCFYFIGKLKKIVRAARILSP